MTSIFKAKSFKAMALFAGLLGLSALFLLSGSFIFYGNAEPQREKQAGEIVLRADDADGHDEAWTRRSYYGLATWGIRGSGEVEGGEMWFSEFPGEDGEYEITLFTLLEQDGSSPYRVSANDRVLQEGKFPYLKGARDCDARGGAGSISLGRHEIKKGERIRVWGESVYECGEKGAYALWYELAFVPIS